MGCPFENERFRVIVKSPNFKVILFRANLEPSIFVLFTVILFNDPSDHSFS